MMTFQKKYGIMYNNCVSYATHKEEIYYVYEIKGWQIKGSYIKL